MATAALPEDRPAPMKTAPNSVMMLAMKRPYILSMSRNCDIERGYQGFLYKSFGFFLCEGHHTRGTGFLLRCEGAIIEKGYLFMAPVRFTVVIRGREI